jgi:hypothetical protein
MKPEITQCPIYWEALPAWANFVTVDADGEIHAWELRPYCACFVRWQKSNTATNVIAVGIIPVNPNYAEKYIWQREN